MGKRFTAQTSAEYTGHLTLEPKG